MNFLTILCPLLINWWHCLPVFGAKITQNEVRWLVNYKEYTKYQLYVLTARPKVKKYFSLSLKKLYHSCIWFDWLLISLKVILEKLKRFDCPTKSQRVLQYSFLINNPFNSTLFKKYFSFLTKINFYNMYWKILK